MAGRRFSDRVDAGRQLADRLARTVVAALGPVVLGLPRGGVPVAAEVAKGLRAPLDVLVIRKVGVPWQPELAVGAVGEGGIRVVNSEIFRSTGLTEAELDGLVARAAAEVEERVRGFRAGRAAVEVAGRDVVLVDDGIATGATMHAAVEVVRARGALTVTVATPVAAVQSLERLRPVADRIVCLLEPSDLRGVGLWYRDFTQTSDSEVAELLSKSG
jgi:putative phosphoribosyl transferase